MAQYLHYNQSLIISGLKMLLVIYSFTRTISKHSSPVQSKHMNGSCIPNSAFILHSKYNVCSDQM